MIVAKEHLIFFEDLVNDPFLQTIHDGEHELEGFYVNKSLAGQALKNELRRNLKALMKIYRYEVINPGNMPNSAVSLKIPFEREADGYLGVKLTVIHNDGTQSSDEYFSIIIESTFIDYNPFH